MPDSTVHHILSSEVNDDQKVHPWRRCPVGFHFVKQHAIHTISILGNYSGELTDHFVNIAHEKLFDSSANICAGIRWLFRKKITASSKLGRTATWIEAVADYKGVLKQNNSRLMEIFQHHYLCMTDGC